MLTLTSRTVNSSQKLWFLDTCFAPVWIKFKLKFWNPTDHKIIQKYEKKLKTAQIK